jgi:hypothetical protein
VGIHGHSWSPVIIRGHSWSPVIIHGHSWSPVVIRGHSCVLLDAVFFSMIISIIRACANV